MSNDYVVVSHFKHVDTTIKAIRALREAGYSFDDTELFTAFPNHELEDEMYKGRKRSPVRAVVLCGALLGCFGAFLMTCWMSIDYPVKVSAKPLISIPSFVVIAFECTILIGSISNLLSMFHFSRIPNFFRFPAFRPNFTNDTFGLTVRVPEEKTETVKSLMEKCGPEKVEIQYVR
ncbi:MAG: DUF3341 domain-containing protein [Proteobacteria bacterium]|nr:DUF3341 domain-containing protein [Pseudomonadota bacterium]